MICEGNFTVSEGRRLSPKIGLGVPYSDKVGPCASCDDPINQRGLGRSRGAPHIVANKEPPNSRISPFERRKEYPSDGTRSFRRRRAGYRQAVSFAYQCDWPLTYMVTVTWGTLLIGERLEGNILGLPERERVAALLRRLRRATSDIGIDWVFLAARAIGSFRGMHVHVLLWWPKHERGALIKALEAATGSLQVPETDSEDVVSECRGWHVERNRRDIDGAMDAAEYLAGQHEVRPELQTALRGNAFSVSRNLGKVAKCSAGWTSTT